MIKVNGSNSSNFNYVEIFNSSSVNFTNVVETKKYLFLSEEKKKIYAIPKESNYKALSTVDAFKENIVDIATIKYNTDFPSVATASFVVAVIDSNNDKTQYSLMPLSLSTILVECHPLTSLLCFLVSEETRKMEFLIMGVNDEFAHVPEVRFTFNVYNLYNYGNRGTIFWLMIVLYIVIILTILTYRLVRLAIKRNFQMKRIEGVKKLMNKNYEYKLAEYKKEIEPAETENDNQEDRISLELVANELST
jgi:hypothetical protein